MIFLQFYKGKVMREFFKKIINWTGEHSNILLLGIMIVSFLNLLLPDSSLTRLYYILFNSYFTFVLWVRYNMYREIFFRILFWLLFILTSLTIIGEILL